MPDSCLTCKVARNLPIPASLPACCAGPSPPLLQDVFSLGCVLAELFLDGQPLFDYSRLLAYRLGSSQAPLAALDKVHHSVRGMVAHMVQRDPAARHTVQQYLQVSLLHAATACLGLGMAWHGDPELLLGAAGVLRTLRMPPLFSPLLPSGPICCCYCWCCCRRRPAAPRCLATWPPPSTPSLRQRCTWTQTPAWHLSARGMRSSRRSCWGASQLPGLLPA